MAVLNIQTGRQKAVQVLGLKELQQQINQIIDSTTAKEAAEVSIQAGRAVLSQVVASARSVNMPRKALEDLFMYTKQRKDKSEASVSVLVGLKKKGVRAPAHGYVVWNAGKQTGAFPKTSRTRRKGQRLNLGGKIGENLGTMWELGTTKMAARPWWRTAIASIRPAVYQIMADGYRGILERHSH